MIKSIKGNGIGNRDSLIINAAGTVTITGNVGGGGLLDLTVNAKRIVVNPGILISTRMIGGNRSVDRRFDGIREPLVLKRP